MRSDFPTSPSGRPREQRIVTGRGQCKAWAVTGSLARYCVTVPRIFRSRITMDQNVDSNFGMQMSHFQEDVGTSSAACRPTGAGTLAEVKEMKEVPETRRSGRWTAGRNLRATTPWPSPGSLITPTRSELVDRCGTGIDLEICYSYHTSRGRCNEQEQRYTVVFCSSLHHAVIHDTKAPQKKKFKRQRWQTSTKQAQ
jgi:hypothetical protein